MEFITEYARPGKPGILSYVSVSARSVSLEFLEQTLGMPSCFLCTISEIHHSALRFGVAHGFQEAEIPGRRGANHPREHRGGDRGPGGAASRRQAHAGGEPSSDDPGCGSLMHTIVRVALATIATRDLKEVPPHSRFVEAIYARTLYQQLISDSVSTITPFLQSLKRRQVDLRAPCLQVSRGLVPCGQEAGGVKGGRRRSPGFWGLQVQEATRPRSVRHPFGPVSQAREDPHARLPLPRPGRERVLDLVRVPVQDKGRSGATSACPGLRGARHARCHGETKKGPFTLY